MDDQDEIPRRGFLRTGVAALAAWDGLMAGGAERPEAVTIGLFADPHYADREPWIGRHFRDSDEKLAEFVKAMNEAKPDFAICLGDLVDKGETLDAETGYLKHIDGIYRKFDGRRHYVIGNHDVATFTKEQFLAATGMPAAHYSFDSGPLHCVVLDANFKEDMTPYSAGNFDWTDTWVPPGQQRWLAADLKKTEKKTLVFVHQALDDEKGTDGVKNGDQVRKILEESGKVLAVFCGHNHRGAYRQIHGIPYFTLRAMVEGPGLENNAYALARISPEGAIEPRGFGKQPSRTP